MNGKKIRLTLLSIALIFAIFSVPFTNSWLHDKIFNDQISILDQAQNTNVEYRLEYRFGGTYIANMSVLKTLQSKTDLKNVLLLMPPAQYLAEQHVEGGYTPPEPAVFYYYTGIRSVFYKSPNVDSANWAFVAEQHRMWLKKIENKQQLDYLKNLYKKYY